MTRKGNEMISLRNVRVGDKFVFSNVLGVHKKINSGRVRCVFGPQDSFGREFDIDPDVGVFVIPPEVRAPKRQTEHEPAPEVAPAVEVVSTPPVAPPVAPPVEKVGTDGFIRVVFSDRNEKVLLDRKYPSEMAMIMAKSEMIRTTLPDGTRAVYDVSETGYDTSDGSLWLTVAVLKGDE